MSIESKAPSRFLSNLEAAQYLGLSPRTLEQYRVSGGGPVYCKLGRRVVYALNDLLDWAEARKREVTSDIL